jgi:hypothetical protein
LSDYASSGNDEEDSEAERLDEVATIKIEVVTRRFAEFITFGLD